MFITCRAAPGRPGDAVGSTTGVIAALWTLPLRAAEISGSERLSPYLQICSAPSVPRSSFRRRRRPIAQAGALGVSCLTSPFPSSLTSVRSTCRSDPWCLRNRTVLDHFSPSHRHRFTPPALGGRSRLPGARLVSLPFSLFQGSSRVGSQTSSSSITGEFASRACSWASPRSITSDSPGVEPHYLEF